MALPVAGIDAESPKRMSGSVPAQANTDPYRRAAPPTMVSHTAEAAASTIQPAAGRRSTTGPATGRHAAPDLAREDTVKQQNT